MLFLLFGNFFSTHAASKAQASLRNAAAFVFLKQREALNGFLEQNFDKIVYLLVLAF